MALSAQDLKTALRQFAAPTQAKTAAWFFKTGPGEYGEGDQFIGVKVPQIRAVCRQFKNLPLKEVEKLLHSPIHEHRLAAVIILNGQYAQQPNQVLMLYLKALDDGFVNNWDIIDSSCEHIVGAHVYANGGDLLQQLAAGDLWHKRVAMVSTFAWLKKGEPGPTLEIAELLWQEKHDLLQKAVGWMLRELGKRVDEELLTDFLDRHAHQMPRTQLRYALERLPEHRRRHYMNV